MSGRRERILNLPTAVTATILVLVAAQCVLEWTPDQITLALVERFAFIPARLSFAIAPDAVLRAVAETTPSGGEADPRLALILSGRGWVWPSLLTYALLHANWTHLAVNVLTLAAFGSPLARRFGVGRFFAFLAVCAVAGALTHLAAHPLDVTPVIGASAAISGTMSAVARFAFGPRRARERSSSVEFGLERHRRAPSLVGLASNQRAMLFLAMWFLVNLLLGVFPQAGGVSGVIAWEAHIGGFVAGLLLFPLFDPRLPADGDGTKRNHGWSEDEC